MHRLKLTLLLAAVLSGCGGSNNTSDPVAACKDVFSTLCNKLFQCNPTQAAQVYGNSSTCASTLSASCNAANTSCPSGTSYNAGNASTCINDYANQSCTDVMSGTTPQSCSHVCQ